jgi:site-specific recombinase XerD
MKLIDRERVDGTQVTIGHRVYYSNGKCKVSRRYAAEYRDLDGVQVCRNLSTTNKSQARRMAVEIQQELEAGIERVPEINLLITNLTKSYIEAIKAKGIARKTEWKYQADLDKLEEYCTANNIRLTRHFTESHLYRYRQWLMAKGYADKTVQGAVILAKQVFKWAWRQKLVKDYRFSGVSFPKAKAKPQPCFTSEQVDKLIEAGFNEEKLAFAFMGYADLRIGEVEQLCWEDLHTANGCYTMIHVRRGGSAGTTKDKDDRFVPVHPKITLILGTAKKKTGLIFNSITERRLLQRLKELCKACKFDNPTGYKLHSFRHHFASLCANHNVAYRKALAWLGHSSSQMLDLYYHLHDEDSQQAMMALAKTENNGNSAAPFEGNWPVKNRENAASP